MHLNGGGLLLSLLPAFMAARGRVKEEGQAAGWCRGSPKQVARPGLMPQALPPQRAELPLLLNQTEKGKTFFQ